MEEYYVRWGNANGCLDKSDYMTKKEAERYYDKLKFSDKRTWKELWYEPIDEEENDDAQYLIKDEEVTKRFDVEIVKGVTLEKTFCVKGFINSIELNAIKDKIGDIQKYPIGKKIIVYV